MWKLISFSRIKLDFFGSHSVFSGIIANAKCEDWEDKNSNKRDRNGYTQLYRFRDFNSTAQTDEWIN